MAITATSSGFKKELIPAGSYVARCYSMVHIGTNTETILGVDKRMNKVRITWELPTELRDFDGTMKPIAISKEYTLSMHEKATLRKDLENWRGKGFTDEQAKNFDITVLLGIPCILSIVHETNQSGFEYAKIGGISGLIKGMECPVQVNPSFEFNFTDKFSMEKLESFPDFIRDKIKTSEEYIELVMGKNDSTPDTGQETDDLPF